MTRKHWNPSLKRTFVVIVARKKTKRRKTEKNRGKRMLKREREIEKNIHKKIVSKRERERERVCVCV